MAKPTVVFVLGPPGAGKGTQSSNIVKNFNFTHLSAGDLLRAERNTGSDLADLINGYIKEGKIVPVKITCGLIEKAMQEDPNSKFLIDGFPRNKDNLDGWNEVMADKVDARFVLFLDCPAEVSGRLLLVSTERCLSRGAAGGGRVDDNLESLQKRHATYENETKPVLDEFLKQGMLRKIDATRDVDAVWTDVDALFREENLA
ncbi:uncharacterized protein MONBRDRAFT_29132 [Monosiga brevicollis MX1]|uniref:UMP-CMP kinase n=1 Tax=Monosiga brevicollis TaxID=81824 RepID=A9VA79_MONBE|nr:uncharacterized protein MONBRDRAFT_29132 [Monosiga brevicollis MX1]EDQ85619.1 predicted protein [Monosiga brevicollis MX1]|eukprot:XP_001749568.1 hypothetical protein [Monosiga brevicollis MX1]